MTRDIELLQSLTGRDRPGGEGEWTRPGLLGGEGKAPAWNDQILPH